MGRSHREQRSAANMRGGGVTLLMLCAAVLAVTNVGTEAASVEEDVVMPLHSQGSALGDAKGVEALDRDKLTIQIHKLQFAKLKAQKDLKRARKALSSAKTKGDPKYRDENVKAARLGVAQAKLALMQTTHGLDRAKKQHKEAVRLSDGAVANAKRMMEKVDERTTKLKIREAVLSKKSQKEVAREKIESALEAAVVAKQMTRAAKKAVADNKKKTVATEALATRTEQLAQHAADSAKNAALKAEDATIMANKHAAEVKVSVQLREERLRRDLRKYQVVADRVGKGKIQRGKRYIKEGETDKKIIDKRIKEGKEEFDDFIKRSKKTVKYLSKRYKGKKTMSAIDKLKALRKKEMKSRDRALQRFKDLKAFEAKQRRSVLREIARGKQLKLDGENMMKEPKAEKKEAKAKAERAKLHKSEMKVKSAKAAKSKAAWLKKQRDGEKAFDAGIKKKSAKLDANLKKKELALAKAEGELSVQKEKVKMAIHPFASSKGGKKGAKKAAKKEAKAIKKELKAEKKKSAVKKVVKAAKKSLKDAKKAAKKMKSGKAKKAAKKQLKVVAKQLKKEKKAMAKETAKVKAASSKMKQNKKALGKDKKALTAARTQVKKAEKKMTKVVKETNSDKIQTKRDAINAAATAKLKAEAKTKKIEAKAAQVSYEQMVAATFREATEQKNTAQANVVAARQSLDRATQNVADAKASLVRAKHKMKHVVNEIRHQIAETKRRNKDQLREKKGIMFEVVNAENAYRKALNKQKEARKFLQRKKKSGKGVKQAKEALAAANVVVASADLSVTRFRNMEKRRKRRARVTDMRAINAGKKAAMLKVDESKSAVASAEEKQRGAQKNLRNALRLRDDANNARVTAQKGMAAYSKGKKGNPNLAD